MGQPVKSVEVFAAIIGEKAAAFLPEFMADVLNMTEADLVGYGLTEKQAAKVVTASAVGRAIVADNRYKSLSITGPDSAKVYCLAQFGELANHGTQEEFWVITLNTKNVPIRTHLITKGTLRNSLVHPREVFRPAIVDSANCILVLHNHPSGETTPSDQDIQVTERLEQAGALLGIPVIDHIVIGSDGATSIQQYRNGRN